MDRGKNRKNKGKASESGTGWSGLSPSGNPHRHAAGNRFVENRVILDHGARSCKSPRRWTRPLGSTLASNCWTSASSISSRAAHTAFAGAIAPR